MSKAVIDELIRKATVEVPHERQWDATIQVFDKKLFAELLIKECARVASDAEENEKEQRSMFYVITEHFGISE